MIRAIAVDDEPPALQVLDTFCGRVDFIDLQRTFTKPHEALKHLRKFPVDLLFLDIHMPALSGIDFYKSLPWEIQVIFTTAHSSYAVEGFNLKATDYLLKPFTFERFYQAIMSAQERFDNQKQFVLGEPLHILLRADYSLVKININDILFIEGSDDYLKVFLNDAKPVMSRMTLKNLLEMLPPRQFLRIHRSFIIPIDKIESVRNKTVKVAGRDLPIGLRYEEHFFKMLGSE